jgi:hypothetical protein
VYYFLNPFAVRLTHIYHCKGEGTAVVCRVVGPAGVAWNGIQVLDVETVVVADVFAEEAWAVFNRDPVSGDLTLRHRIAGDVSKVDFGICLFLIYKPNSPLLTKWSPAHPD